jgi:hypothetical protein
MRGLRQVISASWWKSAAPDYDIDLRAMAKTL